MSIFVDETTKVVYQGLTGGQGSFYGKLNRAYGTQVVAGTSPKKAGTDVDGILSADPRRVPAVQRMQHLARAEEAWARACTAC